MKKATLVLSLLSAVVGLAAGPDPVLADDWPSGHDAAPTVLIFDTDMDTDCDDAGALAMLHALADAGEVEILATMVSSRHKWSVPCVAAINAYYGREALPIGCPKGPGAPDLGSRYARQIAEEFPSALKSNADAPEAARLYRRILAARRDGEVVIVTVGDLTNLRDLLATGPDEHSPLVGTELVRRKVKGWVCMGGRYPRHLDPKVFGNFKPDPASTLEAVANWPTTIYFSGLGDDILTGEPLRRTSQRNPVRRAYELYLGDKPTRPSWDPIATLFAVRGCEPFFQLHRKGYNHIFPNGTNEWRDVPDKNHVLIQLAPDMGDRLRKTIDDLMAREPKASVRESSSTVKPADSAVRGDQRSGTPRTQVAIVGGRWHLNRQVTYPGSQAEGLLMNVRMVNAVFEDAKRKNFDPEANTNEFLTALPDYVAHGVRAFTIGLQGGFPGYEGAVNSAFAPDGSLRPGYLDRVARVIEACDRRGAVVILGGYYQRQDQILRDEAAVRAGVVNVVRWVRDRGYTNVLLEIANEYPHRGFDHEVLRSAVGEASLIELARRTAPGLLVSTSGIGDGKLGEPVARASDFLLIHFNGVPVEKIPGRIADLRKYGKPIVCNEDDKSSQASAEAAKASVAAGASWGLMLEKVNQHDPFSLRGAADDPLVYDTLRKLTTP